MTVQGSGYFNHNNPAVSPTFYHSLEPSGPRPRNYKKKACTWMTSRRCSPGCNSAFLRPLPPRCMGPGLKTSPHGRHPHHLPPWGDQSSSDVHLASSFRLILPFQLIEITMIYAYRSVIRWLMRSASGCATFGPAIYN